MAPPKGDDVQEGGGEATVSPMEGATQLAHAATRHAAKSHKFKVVHKCTVKVIWVTSLVSLASTTLPWLPNHVLLLSSRAQPALLSSVRLDEIAVWRRCVGRFVPVVPF